MIGELAFALQVISSTPARLKTRGLAGTMNLSQLASAPAVRGNRPEGAGVASGRCHRAARRLGIRPQQPAAHRSEEHTSELQSLMRHSYAVFCLKKKKQKTKTRIKQ